ncbi:MAG: class I SAM-dependent methyltransferase [Dehalococcoidia bacterium]
MAKIDYDVVAKDYRAGRGLEENGLAGWRDAVQPHLEGLALPVLDVGSGAGQFSTLFPRWFAVEVVGVEPSDGMRAQAEATRDDPRVQYLAGDAQHLPLPDGSCGAAWISTVIHHIPDLRSAAFEIRRVLASKAPVLIRSVFPRRTSGISLFKYFPEAAGVVDSFPGVEQVREDFGAAGFEFVSLQSVSQVSAPSLAEVRRRVALRADTTLRLISDEAFESGLERLDRALKNVPIDGPVVDALDLVVLRASE